MSLKVANSNFKFFDDNVLPFTIENMSVSGRFIRTSKVITDILDRHKYPESVSRLLGEALLITALIGSGLKLRNKLILQVQGDGAIPLLVTEYTSDDTMRGYADVNKEMFEKWTGGEDINPFLLFGKGHVAITIDQGEGTKPYQGIVPIEGESLSKVVLKYIEQSDQIMSSLKLHLEKIQKGDQTIWRGGAIILQKLGIAGSDVKIEPADQDQAEDWNRCSILFETLTSDEIVQPDITSEDILYRLFHEDGVRVFDKKQISFACSCSRQRLLSFLSSSPKEELENMAKDGKIIADCSFCKMHYIFKVADLV